MDPVVVGVVTALVVSLTKSAVRPAANVATAGVAAPVLSTIEDIISVGLVFLAILIPVAGARRARTNGLGVELWRRLRAGQGRRERSRGNPSDHDQERIRGWG